jgi:hypothetical protein
MLVGTSDDTYWPFDLNSTACLQSHRHSKGIIELSFLLSSYLLKDDGGNYLLFFSFIGNFGGALYSEPPE